MPDGSEVPDVPTTGTPVNDETASAPAVSEGALAEKLAEAAQDEADAERGEGETLENEVDAALEQAEDEAPPERKMPRYLCHKEVSALKIARLEWTTTQWRVHFEHPGFEPILVDAAWVREKRAEAGGYYVVYDDGYTSYSPAAAFEQGYQFID